MPKLVHAPVAMTLGFHCMWAHLPMSHIRHESAMVTSPKQHLHRIIQQGGFVKQVKHQLGHLIGPSMGTCAPCGMPTSRSGDCKTKVLLLKEISFMKRQWTFKKKKKAKKKNKQKKEEASPLIGLAMSTRSPQDWSTPPKVEPPSLPEVARVVTDDMGL